MPPAKRGRKVSSKTKKTAAETEDAADLQLQLRIDSYIKDLDEQTAAFLARWEDDTAAACAALEREYRLAALSLPQRQKHMLWTDWFKLDDGDEDEEEGENGKEKVPVAAAAAAPNERPGRHHNVGQAAAVAGAVRKTAAATAKQRAKSTASTVGNDSHYSLPDSPAASTKKRNTSRKASARKRQQQLLTETPVLTTQHRAAGAAEPDTPVIMPKQPPNLTPMSACRAPHLNEVLWSAKGSPVAPAAAAAAKSVRGRAFSQPTSSKSGALPADQFVQQLMHKLMTAQQPSTSKVAKARPANTAGTLPTVDDNNNTTVMSPAPVVDRQQVGLLAQLNRKLERIVQANQK